jgi:tetratricopeptide (TPR) repeat protein
MKKILVLLCLALLGCAAVTAEKKDPSRRPPGNVECRKVTESERKHLDSIIVMFNEVIRNNPDYGGAYYNRGMAYFYKQEYKKSLHDILKAEALGVPIEQDFIKLIKKLNKVPAKNK